MSRIEKALEEAVRLRQAVLGNGTPAGPAPAGASDEEFTFVPKTPYLVTLTDPDSPVSEEYRKLKTVVIRATKRDAFRNMLLVTSSVSGEGKSITSLNLAVLLAQELSHTVLLIDGDLRRPSLSRYLDIAAPAGLTDCLAKGIDVSDALVRTGIPKLSFLASGAAVKNPVELLSSPKMRELLQGIRKRYRDRYIIMDAPPVLLFAETSTVSTLVDGVIFVVKEGAAPAKSIREALDGLKDASVLGIVFNDVTAAGGSHPYSSYSYRIPHSFEERGPAI